MFLNKEELRIEVLQSTVVRLLEDDLESRIRNT